MTGSAIRLRADNQAPDVFAFSIEFATSGDGAAGSALTAELAAGDGASYDLGPITPPTGVTWREQRTLPLVRHRYSGGGPYTAELRLDGAVAASAVVQVHAPLRRPAGVETAADGPALFALAPVAGEPAQRLLRLHARPLKPGERLRVDGGAGQVRELAGEEGQEVIAEMLLSYTKPGAYLVSVELLDGEGFWLETLAQTPLEIVTAAPEAQAPAVAASPSTAADARTVEAAPVAGAAPWLPYRNFKARPEGARIYSQPGGGSVRRYVGAGVWMTARTQTTVGGMTWYQTAGGGWVRADQVVFFQPSNLQGVLLDSSAPPPPPPPVGNRKGVVTATTLNVRRRPGVAANNPPIDLLRAGAEVTIFEEQAAGGQVWYRIGADRWVAAQWVRLVETRPVGLRAAEAVKLPFGWVVPNAIDVRARPGVASNNPAIGQLHHYDVRPILQTVSANGEAWHQVGDGQWVLARQMGVARLRPRPSSIPGSSLWVAVNLSQQTAVCYQGDMPVFAALVASGLPGSPTVQGIFRTWRRLETGKMVGPGYDIEDVTWTCYFYSGYALHTAYWHDNFGTPRSHGCVNLSPHDAWWIYQWTAQSGPNSPIVYVYWA